MRYADMANMRRRASLFVAVFAALACQRSGDETPAPALSTTTPTPIARSHGVQIAPKVFRPHERQTLSLRVFDDLGHEDEELQPIDGAPLHLVVVDRVLAYFQHFHPVRAATGYTAQITFPRAGEYLAFSYYQPPDGEVQVSRSVLIVGTPSRSETIPPPTTSKVQRRGRYAVELFAEPDPPGVGSWTTLTFRITLDGAPVAARLSSALHHVPVISAGAAELSYAHSTLGEAEGGVRGEIHAPIDPLHEDETIHTPIRDGRISYHVKLPHPGRYKVWIESMPGAPIGFVFDAGKAPERRKT